MVQLKLCNPDTKSFQIYDALVIAVNGKYCSMFFLSLCHLFNVEKKLFWPRISMLRKVYLEAHNLEVKCPRNIFASSLTQFSEHVTSYRLSTSFSGSFSFNLLNKSLTIRTKANKNWNSIHTMSYYC